MFRLTCCIPLPLCTPLGRPTGCTRTVRHASNLLVDQMLCTDRVEGGDRWEEDTKLGRKFRSGKASPQVTTEETTVSAAEDAPGTSEQDSSHAQSSGSLERPWPWSVANRRTKTLCQEAVYLLRGLALIRALYGYGRSQRLCKIIGVGPLGMPRPKGGSRAQHPHLWAGCIPEASGIHHLLIYLLAPGADF